ncbi:NAD-dependent epimerase/dehydratase family protein [Lysinibacillus capsici]|uniref:NAD-dependent epimerase/dehydratase family protein n=1 Tax=Lysinibacillus capsici TaxID=2115968 RepID=UPI002E215B8C|nr:NAD-dependent epimerase/dehydratase family protein [Lysinibacillus capsici]
MTKQKILITGGAGFIGSNLARNLLKQENVEITVIDNLFSGNEKNLDGLNVNFVKGDVTDVELLNKYIEKDLIVFHLAARNIVASSENPRLDMESNIKGTYNILEIARDKKVKKLIYTSTSSVYGNPTVIPAKEESELDFLSFYSLSKYTGEKYAELFNKIYDLPVSIVRYSNVYGFNQHPNNPYSGVIGKFIGNAIKNEPLIIIGDGEQTRDFTFIEDACRATILVSEMPQTDGKVFNIGTGVETSVNELADKILLSTNSSSKKVQGEKRAIDCINRRAVSIEKIKSELGFNIAYSLDEGIEKTIEWFSQNTIN